MVDNRVTFGSKLGVILATVGCAVGLGSIWRFPYMLGTNGGAAFLLIYILFMIFLGIPVMVTEFFIGRYSRSNTVGSFKKMAPGTKWCWIGYNGILAAFLILGFYAVVSGWTLEYVWQTVTAASTVRRGWTLPPASTTSLPMHSGRSSGQQSLSD